MSERVPITVSEHGGQTRQMLTLEVGRKSIDRITLYDESEVLALVARWLKTSEAEAKRRREQ